MTTQQLNNYLADPGAMNAEDLLVIKEYREKYPYAPVFAALYAKVLHNLKDLKYDEALRDAAIVLPDRGVLYQLIYKEPLQQKIEAVQEEVKDVVEIVEHNVAEETPVETKEETNDLEADILIQAINTSIQLDVDQLLEEEVSDSLEDWTESENEEERSSTLDAEPSNPSVIQEPSKFSDWLFAMKDSNEEAELTEQQHEETELLSSQDLIDRFIKSKPRKIDITKEPVTPQEMGKLSLVEDEEFVTETLAEIYAKQGKFQKAIKIYEQLSLTNPEKKVFFASRIRFLREKLAYDK